MNPLDLNLWVRNQRAIGVITIIIGLGAWITDWTGMVYVCPFCRAQRTVIVFLGAFLLLSLPRHWAVRYVGTVIGFFGAVVASYQHFMSWAKISKGTFSWGEQWFMHPFLLSGAALFIIVGQVGLLLLANTPNEEQSQTPSDNSSQRE